MHISRRFQNGELGPHFSDSRNSPILGQFAAYSDRMPLYRKDSLADNRWRQPLPRPSWGWLGLNKSCSRSERGPRRINSSFSCTYELEHRTSLTGRPAVKLLFKNDQKRTRLEILDGYIQGDNIATTWMKSAEYYENRQLSTAMASELCLQAAGCKTLAEFHAFCIKLGRM